MLLKPIREGAWVLLAVCADRGECPLIELFRKLDGALAKDARRMLNLLRRTADEGPPRNTDVSHDLGEGVWEFIQGRPRVFYFYDRDHVIICSHGMVKKSRRTPNAELERVRQCRRRYFMDSARGLNRRSPE